jgi:membrane fusion protein (multidrug efflux system)
VISPGKDGKARAQLRPVRAGSVVGDDVLLEEGLEPGQQVATSGSFKLRDAVLVSVAGDSAAAAAGAK